MNYEENAMAVFGYMCAECRCGGWTTLLCQKKQSKMRC